MKYVVLALALFIGGCTSFTTKTVNPDGTKCEASYSSILQTKFGAVGSACGATGQSENSNSDMLTKALTGALIRGISP